MSEDVCNTHGDVHSSVFYAQKPTKLAEESVLDLAAICFSIGGVCLADSDYHGANLWFTQAASLYPTSIDVKLKRVVALIGLEEWHTSLVMLNECLVSAPQRCADIYTIRAKVHLLQQNWKAAFNDALVALEKCRGNNPGAGSILSRIHLVVEGLANRATLLIAEGDTRERQRVLRYLVDAHDLAPPPISLQLTLRKAWYLRMEGKFGWAIDELRALLSRADALATNCPKDVKKYIHNIMVRAHWQLALCFNETGVLHFKGGDFEKAIDCFNKAIKADKAAPMFFANRADCYWHLGKAQLALANYHQALNIDPTLELVSQQLACMHNAQGCKLSTQGKYAEALYEFTEALSAVPKTAKTQVLVVMHNRTKTLLQLQQWAASYSQAVATLRVDPGDSGALYITRMLQTTAGFSTVQ